MERVDREIVEANEAEALLTNPVFKAAWEHTEKQIFEQLRKVGVNDSALQLRLVLALQLLGTLKTHIEQTIQTGKMARLELDNRGKVARMFR